MENAELVTISHSSYCKVSIEQGAKTNVQRRHIENLPYSMGIGSHLYNCEYEIRYV